MFGENESESPRQPSPWQSLPISNLGTNLDSPRTPELSATPDLNLDLDIAFESLSIQTTNEVGGIGPEVDTKGHIEYKLKLIEPSPERFNKLVTQLHWRLLEGGGRAIYEIGVRDDGALVGLNPKEMAKSLQVLNQMANSIGAVVKIVKELELDPTHRIPSQLGTMRQPRKKFDSDAEVEPATPPETTWLDDLPSYDAVVFETPTTNLDIPSIPPIEHMVKHRAKRQNKMTSMRPSKKSKKSTNSIELVNGVPNHSIQSAKSNVPMLVIEALIIRDPLNDEGVDYLNFACY